MHIHLIWASLTCWRKHKHGRSNRDIEADSVPPPGSPAFAAYYQVQANAFLKSKEIILRGWAEQHGIELPQDFFTNPDAGVNAPSWSKDGSIGTEHHMLRRQLFLFLHIEFLTMNVGKRTGGLIFAVDQLRQRRKLDRNRLIVPGFKRIRKYALAVLFSNERDHENNDLDGPSATVYLGEAFKKRRRPQHLAPANVRTFQEA